MLHTFNSRTLEAEVGSQPGLQSLFQDSQATERPCHNKTKQNKPQNYCHCQPKLGSLTNHIDEELFSTKAVLSTFK